MQVLMAAIVALSFATVLRAASTDGKPKERPVRQPDRRGREEDQDPAVHVYDGSRRSYQENHVPSAVLLYSKDIKEGVLPDKKDTTLIFYCHNEL
jgi:hypothetical protein